jgi:hypothetical protein
MSLVPIGAGRARPRRRRTFAAVLGLMTAVSLAVAGCGLTGSATFDPTGPCVGDGRVPGAYPELEALVPATLDGRPPDRLDSGRNCTTVNLGTLAGHGIDEVRFAGGLWELGAESGTTLAVFTADGLTAEWLGEFYEDGARQSRKTSDIVVTHPTIEGGQAFRMDLVNDGRLQTIVALDGDDPGLVRVALVSSAARDVGQSTAHEASVTAALQALTAGGGGG